MVDLVPKNLASPLRAQNYTTRSKSPSPSQNTNKVLGSLFGGIGNLVTPVTEAVHTGIVDKGNEEVKNLVSLERGQPGDASYDAALATVKDPSDLADGGQDPRITSYAKDVRRIVAARKAGIGGVSKDTVYYQRLGALNASIKARYPGFEKEIDKAFRRETGTDTANALRRARLAEEAKAGTSVSSTNKTLFNLVKNNTQFLPKELADAIFQQPNNTKLLQKAVSVLGDTKREAREISDRSAQLRLQTLSIDASGDRVVRALQEEVTRTQRVQLRLAGKSLDLTSYNDTQKLTPEERAQIGPKLQELRVAALENLHRRLRVRFKDSKDTLMSRLRPAQLATLEKAATSVYDRYIADIKDGDIGLVKRDFNARIALENAAKLKLMDDKEFAHINTLLNTPAGRELFKSLSSTPTGLRQLKDIHRRASKLFTFADTDKNGPGFKKVIDSAKGSSLLKVEKNRFLLDQLNTRISTLLDPKKVLEPDQKSNLLIKSLGGENGNRVFRQFGSVEEKVTLLGKFLTPAFVDSVMGEGTSPEAKRAFGEFIAKNFAVVLKTELDTIKYWKESTSANIHFDSKNKRLVVEPGEYYQKQLEATKGKPYLQEGFKTRYKGIQKRVDTLNTLLGPMSKAFEGITIGGKPLSIEEVFRKGGDAAKAIMENPRSTLDTFEAPKGPRAINPEQRGQAPTESSVKTANLEGGRDPINFSSTRTSQPGSLVQQTSFASPKEEVKDFIPLDVTKSAYTTPPKGLDTPATQAIKGAIDTSNVVYDNKGAIRNKKLQPALEATVGSTARKYGLGVSVFSGGQTGRRRTGSHRHDKGNAGDIQLIAKDGRILSHHNTEDQKIIAAYITDLVAGGVNGVGAGDNYMGSTGTKIHVGGGSAISWGAGGRSRNAPQWLKDAHAEGLRLRRRKGGWKPRKS